ncbi:hypothetical protein A0O32_2451 [Anoxybacillus flavithermus]|nr:hypothetical protein A0O32_2451 [Anoxybacillus flavithermus]
MKWIICDDCHKFFTTVCLLGGVDMWKRHEKTLVFVSFAVAAVVLLSLIGRLFS